MGFGGYDGSIKIDTKLDTGNIEKSLGSLGQSVKKGFAAVGIGVAAGLGAATKAGMDFEAQMSKVAAISSASSEDLRLLTEKAKQMGIDTKFSATEAGEALEYMAMAGWKTEDMLNGIDGIMNLAAASGENLGQVSDIVTDALTAFGLQAKDSAHFADVLAKASNDSNTDVAMMGQTFKYVGAVAGAMKFSIEDTSVAIGLMANAGIKAEQAGTSLRAVFTRLAKPPKEAAKAIEALGLQITNADGSFKSLGKIITDMRKKFAKLTDVQKTQYAAMIGGQEAMSGLLAIINASEDDFNKLTKSINNADGSAKKMADTMNDNLKGQIVLLGSSLEGLGLAIYDGINQPMKEAVKTSIDSVNGITASFQSGELKEAITSAGNLLGGLVTTLTNFVTAVLPPLAGTLAFLGKNIGIIAPIVGGLVVGIKSYTLATTAATAAQSLLNTAMSLNPVGLLIAGIAGLTVALGALGFALASNTNETQRLVTQTREQKKAYDELKQAQEEKKTSELAELSRARQLRDELSGLVDENGHVEEANRSRAGFIVGELNEAFGLEMQMIDGTIKGYKEISASIDDIINKKRAQIMLEAEEETYRQAIINIAEAHKAQASVLEKVAKKQDELRAAQEIYAQQQNPATLQSIQKLQGELEELQLVYYQTSDTVDQYSSDITRYEAAAAASIEGNIDGVINALDRHGDALYKSEQRARENSEEEKRIAGEKFSEAMFQAEAAAQNLARYDNQYNREALERAKTHAENMKKEFIQVGGNVVDGTIEGIGAKEGILKRKLQSLSALMPEWMRDMLGINSPSKVMRDKVGISIPEGIAVGIDKKADTVYKALTVLNNGMLESEKNYISEKERIDAEREKREEEQREKEYQKRLKNAKTAAEIEEIKQEEILRKQKIAEDKYLEELRAKFDEEQKILEEQKNAIVSAYTEIAKSAKAKLSEIEQAQSKLADKMKAYGSLYTEWTTTIKGGGENGQDLVFTEYRLNDLSKDIEALEAYKNALLAVKERGAPDGFFEVLQDLGIDEGTQFANTLLGLSDEEFKKYLDDWNRKNEVADSISKEFYKDKTDETLKEIEDELAAWYGTIPEGFLTEGKLSAEKFGEGFMEQLDSVFKEMEEAVSMNVSRISPTLTFGGGSAAGGNTTYSTTNQTFTIGTSKNTTSEQISQWQNATEVARLRGQA